MIADVLTTVFLVIGCFFLLMVTVGLFRLPDALSRLHLTNKSDTIGKLSVLLAAAIYIGWSPEVLRLLVIGALLAITSITSSHAIGRSLIMMRERARSRGKTSGREEDASVT